MKKTLLLLSVLLTLNPVVGHAEVTEPCPKSEVVVSTFATPVDIGVSDQPQEVAVDIAIVPLRATGPCMGC